MSGRPLLFKPNCRMIGLRKIAEEAGVSVATVSRALRNDHRVAAATRERVEAVARLLDYRSNPLAERLMSGFRRNAGAEQHLGTIALLFYKRPTSGVGDAQFNENVASSARRHGFGVDLFYLDEYTPDRLRQILLGRGVRGVVVGAAYHSGKAILRLKLDGFASVLTGWGWYHPPLHRVAVDHHRTMFLALHHARHLYGEGIAALVSDATDRRTDRSQSGAFLAQHPAGHANAPKWLFYDRANDLRRLDAAVRSGKVRCLILSSRFILPKELLAYKDRLDFISLDGPINLPGLPGPGHIDQRTDLLGTWAVDLLASNMWLHETGVPDTQKVLLVEPRWVPTKNECPSVHQGNPKQL